MLIKKLLKKYKYPPEGMDNAVKIVMTQCELWTDNYDMNNREKSNQSMAYSYKGKLNLKVAEETASYGNTGCKQGDDNNA